MVRYRTFPPIPEQLRPRIDSYWATFLGCGPASLYPTQPVTLWSENSPGLLGLQTNRQWLLALHPAASRQPELLADLLPLLAADNAFVTAGWQQAVQDQLQQRAFVDLYGPAHVLYCAQVMWPADVGPPVRLLSSHDQACVQQFQQAMGAVVWHLDQPSIWPRIAGIFQNGHLVAAGAVRCWGNAIGEIFVDTLPAYRNRGYAKTLTSYLTQWVLRETPWLPQYDAEVHNIPSLHVARAVGYTHYGMLLLGSLAALLVDG